jgi:GDP-L-fucose synthase
LEQAMMNLLITGGTGFIGRNLTESLRDRYNIFAPTHKELDLLDLEALSRFIDENKIDIVIHGAIHVPMFNGKEKECFNDLKMFLNLEKVSGSIKKLMYFGSGAEYDKRFDIRNVTEDVFGTSIPDTEYGLAKYTMNKIARKSDNIYNLRLFGIFGKYELWQLKFISNLCCKALFDLPLTIRKDCMFNFLYINDLPGIIDRFIESSPVYHDYNITHDRSYMLSEIANIVKEVSSKDLEIKLLSKEFNLDYTACNKRLREEFPDVNITPLKAAIEDLYNYYDSHRNIIDLEELKKSC